MINALHAAIIIMEFHCFKYAIEIQENIGFSEIPNQSLSPLSLNLNCMDVKKKYKTNVTASRNYEIFETI